MKLYITPSGSFRAQGVPRIPLKITRVQYHNKQRLHPDNLKLLSLNVILSFLSLSIVFIIIRKFASAITKYNFHN